MLYYAHLPNLFYTGTPSMHRAQQLASGEKYCQGGGAHGAPLIAQAPLTASRALLGAAYASSTWGKHSTALSSYKKFAYVNKIAVIFPFSVDDICGFTSWALIDAKLKPSTVKSYLSSLAVIHKLRNASAENFDNFIIKNLIKGAENISFYDEWSKGTRKVMTLPLLKLVGHEIAKSNWSENSKQLFWTCCLMSFFGSFRIGELLCCNKDKFVPKETLTWGDILFRGQDSILVHLKITKNRSIHGETVDLFKYDAKGLCPVKALQKWKELSTPYSSRDRPVFEFDNGVLLTPSVFNTILQNLLRPHVGTRACLYTSHSFRAALPSAMAADPIACNSVELKQWGRWYSDSYLLYTRLKLDQKRALFSKIVSILNKVQS